MAIHITNKFGQLKLSSEVVTGLDLASLSALSSETSAGDNKFVTNVTETEGQIQVSFAQPSFSNISGKLACESQFDTKYVYGGTAVNPTNDNKLVQWKYVKNAVSSLTGGYDNTSHYITLSSAAIDGTAEQILNIDCADFIKDGMLCSVALCGEELVLTWNTDGNKTPISVNLSSFVDTYTASNGLVKINKDFQISCGDNVTVVDGKLSARDTTYTAGKGLVLSGDANEFSISADYAPATISDDIKFLSDEIDSKIFVDDRITGATANQLSVVKLPLSDWMLSVAQKSDVISSELSNVLFLPQSDYIEAYGQVISNLTMPEDVTDPLSATLLVESVAATKEYVDKKAFDALTHVLSGITLLSSMDCGQMFGVLSGIVKAFGGTVIEG